MAELAHGAGSGSESDAEDDYDDTQFGDSTTGFNLDELRNMILNRTTQSQLDGAHYDNSNEYDDAEPRYDIDADDAYYDDSTTGYHLDELKNILLTQSARPPVDPSSSDTYMTLTLMLGSCALVATMVIVALIFVVYKTRSKRPKPVAKDPEAKDPEAIRRDNKDSNYPLMPVLSSWSTKHDKLDPSPSTPATCPDTAQYEEMLTGKAAKASELTEL